MKKVIASAGLLALGAVGSQTAMAQWTAASDKPWSVSAALRGFYDDNINTSPQKVSSSGFEIDPSISYSKNFGPTTVTAGVSYYYRYYTERVDNKADQGTDINFLVQHDFNERYSLGVEDHFIISQEPEFSASTVSGGVAVTTPLRSNGDNKSNQGAIRFHAQLTRLMGFMVSYQNTIYDYEENAQNTLTPSQPSRSALLDRMEQKVTLENTWVLSELTTGIIGYAFGAVDYNSNESIDSPTFIVPGVPTPFISSSTRNNYSHFFYLGAEHQFRPDLHGSARAGIQYSDYYNAGNLPAPFVGSTSDNLSPYINLNLGYDYADGGLLNVGFQQVMNQTDQAVSFANPTAGVTQAQESSVFYGSISKKLTPISPRLTGSLTGQFQHSVFIGGPSDGEVDNFYVFGINLSYQFDRYFSAEVGYNYDLLNSDLPSRGYDRNRVYAGVTGSY